MKIFNKIVFYILTCSITFLSTNTIAAEWGQGRVNMQGSIVETACAIDTGDRKQSIEMGTLPVDTIIHEGKGNDNTFDIRLSHCVLSQSSENTPDQKHFQITFNGISDRDNFKVSGDAQGVSLMITDTEGNIAQPGVPLPFKFIPTENMNLTYRIFLVGDHQEIRPGEYKAVIRFGMNYY